MNRNTMSDSMGNTMSDGLKARQEASHKTLEIGTSVTLLFPMLGNKPGAKGYVFATYPDFDKKGLGAQIILENGQTDGFSVFEQEAYLRIGDVDPRYADYDFENVMQVSRDFANGFWEF